MYTMYMHVCTVWVYLKWRYKITHLKSPRTPILYITED